MGVFLGSSPRITIAIYVSTAGYLFHVTASLPELPFPDNPVWTPSWNAEELSFVGS